jgi:hypothetical protein
MRLSDKFSVGSPPFEFFPLNNASPSPIRPRPPGSRSPRSFSYRAITERPFPQNTESQFSTNVTSDDDSHFIVPDFDLSDVPANLTDLDPPTFGAVIKKAAVRALSVYSQRGSSLKPLCDRVYGHFFQAFDDWSLKQAKKNKRSVIQKPMIDDRLAAQIQKKFAELTAESWAWEAADPRVAPLAVDSPQEVPVEESEVDVRTIEDLIFQTDRVAQKVSRLYARGQALDMIGRELAERMRALAAGES